jgi:hypothetical protein
MRRFRLLVLAAGFTAAVITLGTTPIASFAGSDRTPDLVRRALLRLPYYGVFDFLVFSVDRGTVTLMGYAYRQPLKAEAAEVIRRTMGVDEIVNKIEILPTSQRDDRIRWATFYSIYTDETFGIENELVVDRN